MASFNKYICAGNLTRDVEIRVTPAGKSIAGFSVAISRKSGQTEEVMFLDCEAWEKTAELIGKYCAKGSSVLLEGRLKQDNWDDKATGAKRSKIKLVVEQVQFLGAPKGKQEQGESESSSYSAGQPMGSSAKKPAAGVPSDHVDEDAPF